MDDTFMDDRNLMDERHLMDGWVCGWIIYLRINDACPTPHTQSLDDDHISETHFFRNSYFSAVE